MAAWRLEDVDRGRLQSLVRRCQMERVERGEWPLRVTVVLLVGPAERARWRRRGETVDWARFFGLERDCSVSCVALAVNFDARDDAEFVLRESHGAFMALERTQWR